MIPCEFVQMFTISAGRVFVDQYFGSNDQALDFFKFCTKNESILFPVKI